MADQKNSIDFNSGFCSKTRVFNSLRPHLPLPSISDSISVTHFAFSLIHSFPSPPPTTTALLDAVTRRRVSFPEFILRIKTLSSSLHMCFGLHKGDTAFILSANSIYFPILCFSLFSLGVIVSPSNPASSNSEILHQIRLSKPVIAFATSDVAHKIPCLRTIIIDSPEFESLMTASHSYNAEEFVGVKVYQSDPAAILYSSGTTGRVKGVMLTHQNFTFTVAVGQAIRSARNTPIVSFCVVPYFHVYGLAYVTRTIAMGETAVSMAKFDMKRMLGAIQEFRITHMALAPPVVVAMIKNNGLIDGYDLSSLEVVACGGAPLRRSVVELFRQRFPNVILGQAYGLTESTGRVFGTVGPQEGRVMGATGKLMPNCQAKIVDPDTGISLPTGSPGELWIRGPAIMKGYVGDEEATAATLDSEGWLKTGDLCYIDNEGFLFFVDRIKELIKYKGYQVSPAELEHLLQSRSEIAEAAVIPYPDEEAGQIPVAFIVRQRRSAIDESQIKDFIAQKVAPYKRIRRVIFIDSLPRNATGKVLRKVLTELAISSPTSKL